MPAETLRPATAVSGASSPRRSLAGPKYWPLTLTSVDPPLAVRWKIEVTSGRACGAHACQAASASAACDHGQLTVKPATVRGTG